ncbi:DUF4397 domain-containing protein [Hymenobacter sp. HSC-4F20]|uniref:DUF4397 domain-containing protein n=1 Tax=Hymenobacter sp. HSC-4F20 TaxID=2864135 RepID=UPI001C737C43|nr:DUF4397 domain-containing protein [Hymenobacter sp. HSC-4F20]MBX0291254.1 DUF4397 domain-containing protein [Hymenobacter sp. HSC-4F20]
MKTLTSFLRPALLLATLPAALAFTACSDDDDNNTAAPDQSNVLISHAAASANVQVTALADDKQVGQLNYGQSSGYVKVNAGTPTLKINNSAGQTAASQSVTIAKDQNYSVFAYAPTPTTVGLLPISDDLTAPAAGQAKVRVVHLALGAPATVKLSQQTVAGATDVPGVSAAFGAASAFVSIPASSYNLLVTTGTPSTMVVAVGDGTGTGSATATKNYEAGKIYTVVVRGIASSIDPALQTKAVVIQHN